MVWLWLTLRIFGTVLLVLLGLVILLLFVPVQVRVRWEKEDRYAEGRFLFFKYRYELDFLNGPKSEPSKPVFASEGPQARTVISDEAAEIEASLPKIEKYEEPPAEAAPAKRSLKAPFAFKAKRPFKMFKALKAPSLKAHSPSKAFASFAKLRSKLHRYMEIFFEGKPILYRLLKQVKVKRADCRLHYSVSSPVLTAQLMGLLWATEAQLYGFFKRRFKKVKHHRFDLRSDFTGDYLDVGIDYIASVRPIDVLLVGLRSLAELKALRRLVAKQRASAQPI